MVCIARSGCEGVSEKFAHPSSVNTANTHSVM